MGGVCNPQEARQGFGNGSVIMVSCNNVNALPFLKFIVAMAGSCAI